MSPRNTTTYSHSGCTRCKKMKVKCDEKRPACGGCSRKKINCLYDFPFVMYNPNPKRKSGKDGGKVSKKGFKLKNEDKRLLEITLPSEFTFVSQKFSDDSSSSDASPPASEISYTDNGFRIDQSGEIFEPAYEQMEKSQTLSLEDSQILVPNTGVEFYTQIDEFSKIKSEAVEEFVSLDEPEEPEDESLQQQTQQNQQIQQIQQNQQSQQHQPQIKSEIISRFFSPQDVQLPSFFYNFYLTNTSDYVSAYFSKAQPIIEKYNLQPEDAAIQKLVWLYFTCGKALTNHLFIYNDFQNNNLIEWLMVLGQDDATTSSIINVSITAACASGIYAQTKIEYWKQVREKYMDKTLEILSDSMASDMSFTVQTCLLFTVLLLYSERSCTDSPVWRLHLQGALQLLTRFVIKWDFEELHANKSDSRLKAALLLFHFCECWFLSAESLAWISSFEGGSLPCSSEMDLINAKKVLENHLQYETGNHLVPGGFNTVRFYPQQFVPVMNDIVCHTMELKTKNINVSELYGFVRTEPPTELSYTFGAKLIERIDATWEYVQATQMKYECPDANLAETVRCTSRCYVLGMKCYVYSNFMGLEIYSQEIQQLIEPFLDSYYAMPYNGSCALSVQWPCYILACCTPQGQLREEIIQPLHQMLTRSMYGAHYSLLRIRNVWEFFDNFGQIPLDAVEKIDTVCF